MLVGEKSNFIPGESKYLVVEACEYRRSFLNINPKILVITNIDADHLDYYKDIEDIKSAFREFVAKVPEDGFIICNPNDDYIADVIKDANAKVINYHDYFNKDLKLKVPGIHNKKDAAAAIAVANLVGIDREDSEKYVGRFPGTWRRFEHKGTTRDGAEVYDDYAHHPTEIATTLEGFRELYSKADGWNLTVIFQPHLFSRTKLLLNDFAKSFGNADKVLILPIYYAREEDDGTISSEILAEKINAHQDYRTSEVFGSFEELENKLKNHTFGQKDIIVTMGAGEAFKIGDWLLGL